MPIICKDTENRDVRCETIREFAQRLSVPEPTVYYWRQRGMPVLEYGATVFVITDEALTWVRDNTRCNLGELPFMREKPTPQKRVRRRKG